MFYFSLTLKASSVTLAHHTEQAEVRVRLHGFALYYPDVSQNLGVKMSISLITKEYSERNHFCPVLAH